eukprot:10873568-Lingulodinium_polyedra.AAC.1
MPFKKTVAWLRRVQNPPGAVLFENVLGLMARNPAKGNKTPLHFILYDRKYGLISTLGHRYMIVETPVELASYE